ncbi:MAG: peptide-methionine (S)-S-oxide reductase MsrA [Notoacmeibacter sp.]|nr:peptide-methionine (S)-S-oxide reductase MsrA [Notoacmeibacter sp.]MCC0032473.1 peptide-methionine (S)-S-oxide reductase MsrA [Brucellaceae bacterium]
MHFLGNMLNKKMNMPSPEEALKGRAAPVATAQTHFVNGHDLHAAAPAGHETVFFGMGNYWGAEKLFWQQPGVHVTAAGFQGGYTPNPTHQEVITGQTGHAHVVKVNHDPAVLPFSRLLTLFWENHDPTQGNKQGADIGTAFRSAIFTTTPAQLDAAIASRDAYQLAMTQARNARITTEIRQAPDFYFAGTEHQQYLARNPAGSNTLKGTGIPFPG